MRSIFQPSLNNYEISFSRNDKPQTTDSPFTLRASLLFHPPTGASELCGVCRVWVCSENTLMKSVIFFKGTQQKRFVPLLLQPPSPPLNIHSHLLVKTPRWSIHSRRTSQVKIFLSLISSHLFDITIRNRTNCFQEPNHDTTKVYSSVDLSSCLQP